MVLTHEERDGREVREVTMNPEGTNSYCSPLVGEQLRSVEKRDFSWFFGFSGEVSLATETFWRLINEDRIVVTSEDHGHQFGLPERTIEHCRTLCGRGGDRCVLGRPDHRVQRTRTATTSSDVRRIRIVEVVVPGQRDHMRGRRQAGALS